MQRRTGFRYLYIIAILIMTAAGCARSASSQGIDKPNPPLKTVMLSVGPAQVKAELAMTEIERERGLMFRSSLKEGEGMLFVFDRDQSVSFWMKNTKIPLSIAYILSDGTIVQILDLEPYSEEPRPSIRSIRYALEVPQGWFARAGVKVGDRVVIPPLSNP